MVNVINFVNKQKNQERKNIWIIGGGELLHSFLQEKLVDGLIIIVTITLFFKKEIC
ncbi:hypothetical protein B4065_0232 [Caldibacillus thermoamylovorans]|uniref:Dihydrofolate reductase n=1 Tax=Caldibacillus thermoamylovorans TaxID=35841 RepID=A0ABD4A1C3_9BACI|nr:hypothetical protein B4065_0232 [Caldibacillus thermoamylovorans]KIO69258.1 hypothetical protein B4166_1978 [Caldibacillus thermoamylovorans]KIO70019.1 hypothetical protein B4167_0709 [Caldibacillus thermoamylovorans]